MILRTLHLHPDGTRTEIDLDTTGEVRDTHAQRHQRQCWQLIREACGDAIAVGAAYEYFDGRRKHTVRTMTALAAVTRRERTLWGVEWREDGVS